MAVPLRIKPVRGRRGGCTTNQATEGGEGDRGLAVPLRIKPVRREMAISLRLKPTRGRRRQYSAVHIQNEVSEGRGVGFLPSVSNDHTLIR